MINIFSIPDGRVYSYFLEWHRVAIYYITPGMEVWENRRFHAAGGSDVTAAAVTAACGKNAWPATFKKRDIEVQVQEEKIFREDFLR